MNESTTDSGKVPALFRVFCEMPNAWTGNYRSAGYELAQCTVALLKYKDEAEKRAKLEELLQAVTGCTDMCVYPVDEPAVIAWYERELPHCMELIPPQSRLTFAQGVRKCWEDRRLILSA